MLSSQNVPLLFVASIPTYLLNFKFFNHSSLFAFIHAKHSPTELYQCTCTVLLSNHNQSINQSIHINLSAGAQILQALT